MTVSIVSGFFNPVCGFNPTPGTLNFPIMPRSKRRFRVYLSGPVGLPAGEVGVHLLLGHGRTILLIRPCARCSKSALASSSGASREHRQRLWPDYYQRILVRHPGIGCLPLLHDIILPQILAGCIA